MERSSHRIVLGLFLSFLALGVAPAAAQVAGCNPAVLNAMNARAQAQMAYDIAVTNEMIDKPDSVLTLTCFNRAAGVSAAALPAYPGGGNIFSGDFTAGLNPVVPTSAPPFACTEMALLWAAISTEGVNTAVPYATFTDLLNGNTAIPAGAGVDYTASWTSARPAPAAVFTNLTTAVAALPAPVTFDFTPAQSSCQVLVIAGIIPGPCP